MPATSLIANNLTVLTYLGHDVAGAARTRRPAPWGLTRHRLLGDGQLWRATRALGQLITRPFFWRRKDDSWRVTAGMKRLALSFCLCC